MAAVVKGTAHVYGINGSVASLTVQSYTVARSFELDDKVAAEHGRTITHRLDGRMNELTLEGVLVTSGFSLQIGDNLSFAGNEISFSGHITRIDDRGQARGFTLISITAVEFEEI